MEERRGGSGGIEGRRRWKEPRGSGGVWRCRATNVPHKVIGHSEANPPPPSRYGETVSLVSRSQGYVPG